MLPTGLVALVDPEELDDEGDEEADVTDVCGAAVTWVAVLASELDGCGLPGAADDSAASGEETAAFSCRVIGRRRILCW